MKHTSAALIRSHAWYCLPDYWHAAFSPDLAGAASSAAPAPATPLESIPARPLLDRWGDPLPRMTLTDSGVAIVPIQGALLKGASGSDKFYMSVSSYEDIEEDIDAAMAASARGILLLGKSAGGTVTGAPELGAKVSAIARSGYPIISYTEDMLCSAVEMITAGCSARLATPSAICGSIGVIYERLDASKHFAAQGITYNVFTSGSLKAYGNPALEMTADQRSWLQSYVDARGAEFRAHMLANRPQIPEEAMQGQIFSGAQASEIGLIDLTVSGLAEALSFFPGR